MYNSSGKESNITSEITSQLYKTDKKGASGDIAVIHIAGRFPGVKTIHSLWELLISGKSTVKHFTKAELEKFGVNKKYYDLPNYRPITGYIEDLFYFDAESFNLNPKSACLLDPHHRILLELADQLLKETNYSVAVDKQKIGIFCGMSESGYTAKNELNKYLTYSKEYNEIYNLTNKSFLATLIAYKLGLRGPAINVDTGCSTSLVALIEACNSLIKGECDMAIAGGASLIMPHEIGYLYEREHIFSEQGACLPFSCHADGMVPASGAGLVLCKRLDNAIRDKDNILAVINGYSINNDGQSKAGFMAPSITGQSQCIREAYESSNIPLNAVRYIEAHGTGTHLGDLVELQALKEVFSSVKSSEDNLCAIGSIKYNIGHSNYASGIAGLIKAILMLVNDQIPPMPYFDKPNRNIDFGNTPFYVNKIAEKFSLHSDTAYASVSSFGVGGTNAHVILSGFNENSSWNENLLPPNQNKQIYDMDRFLSADLVDHSRAKINRSERLSLIGRLKIEWEYILGLNDISMDQDFFDLGGDSLLVIDILAFIEKEFGTSLNLNELLNARTIRQQADIISRRITQTQSSICVKFDSNLKGGTPVILVHPIGGSLFSFMPLVTYLKNEYVVYGIQDPLVCGQYVKFSSVEELAAHYIAELRKTISCDSYILAGYSAGGTIAFEMLRQLKQAGIVVQKLIMFDAWAKFPSDLATLDSLKIVIERQLEGLKLNLFPHFELRKDKWFSILENRLSILLKYFPKKADANILLFKASELFAEYKVLQEYNHRFSNTNGWEEFVDNVETVEISGHHEEILKHDNVRLIYNAIMSENLNAR